MTDQNKRLIVIVLDRSGSMMSLASSTSFKVADSNPSLGQEATS